MDQFKNYITNDINEASYKSNIGFVEMAQFYQKASKKEIAEMEVAIKAEDWEEFKAIIYKKLNVKLK